MNNGIFDFKKKIAFTAALVIVAHSFGTLPASAASATLGALNTDTVGVPDDGTEVTDGGGDAENTESGTADETTTATTTTTTTSATTTTTTSVETTVTTSTTTQQSKVTYNVVVNGGISEENFILLVSTAFKGKKPSYDYNGKNGGTITVNSDDVPSDAKLSLGSTEYRRKSASGTSLVYDAYYKAELPSDAVTVIASGIPADGFCKNGSDITVKSVDEYTLVESDEEKTIKVESPLNFTYESIGNDEYRLNFVGGSYIISPRLFKLKMSDNYKLYRGDNEIPDRILRWKDIGQLRIKAEERQALSVSDGSKSHDFKVVEDFVKLSEFLNVSQFRYSNNAEFVVTGVNWKVSVKSIFEGEEDKNTTRYFHVEKDSDNKYFFRVPYLELGNFYLNGYKYGKLKDADLSKMFSDMSDDKDPVGYCRIPYIPNMDDIELHYVKFKRFGSYTFAPSQDITLRSGNCFSLDSSDPHKSLMTFPADFDSSLLSYECFGGSDASGLKTLKAVIQPGDREFNINTTVMKNPVFILVKNVIKDSDDLTSGLEDSICFYNDKNSPTVSDTEERDENKWYGKEGAEYILDIHDRENCPIPENDTIYYEEKEIRDVYEKLINAPTVDKQEIASVIVGDYRFDRPERGWGDTSAIKCYIENSAVRNTEKALIELLRETELSEISAKYADQGDSYNYYKKIINKGVCSELETYYASKLKELEKDEDKAGEAAEISIAAAKLESCVTAYEKAKKDAKNTHKTVPSLTFDTETQNFKVTLKPADGYKDTIIRDTVNVYAVDNSGNSGMGTEKMYTINVRMDCAPPVFSGEPFMIRGAEKIEGADGSINYVVKNGTFISASMSDISDGTEGSGVGSAEWYIGDNDDFKKQMWRDNNSEGFWTIINDDDIKGKNIKSYFSVRATDNVGNSSVFRSDKTDKKVNVIFDSARPLSSIVDASDASKVHRQEVREGDEIVVKKWYSSYEDIRLSIFAADVNPDKCSGIRQLNIEINGHECPAFIAGDNIDPELLKAGKYYIAFEKGTEEDCFDAYLRCTADSEYNVRIYSNLHRLGREEDGSYNNRSESGSIQVKFSAKDNAWLDSPVTEERVYVDLDAPVIAGADMNGGNILRGDADFRFEAFSDGQTSIRVRVGDSVPSSGISEVKADLFDKDGNIIVSNVKAQGAGDEWELKIPVNFKGFARITAVDNVGKSSDFADTLGIITENSGKHSTEKHVFIDLPQTGFTDRNGLPLYNSQVNAKLTVRDTFSGIADVFTSVSGENETRLGINRDGIKEDTDADSWNINEDKSENNLVTEVTRDLVILQNSNGNRIAVRMNDNAGNPDQDYVYEDFSIDTVKPVIKVEFTDGNGSADSEYKNIFKSGRKAVITVTERNFDPSLAEVMINGERTMPTWSHTGGTEGTDTAQYSAEVNIDKDGTYKITVNCKDMGDLRADTYNSEEFIIDRTAPTLSVGFDKDISNQHYYNAPVTATFRISETNFDPKRITISGTLDNKSGDFPKASDWVKSGNDYVSTVKFDKNGDYEITVSGRDKAGNQLDTYSETFCIDTKKPTIGFSDISRSNNGKEIRPSIRFDDANIKKETIKVELEGANRGKVVDVRGSLTEKNGGYEYVFDNIPNKPEYDDIYTIKATAEDNASNKIEKKFRFSVNRFGSTFTLSNDTAALNGGYLPRPKDVIITEYNADKHAKAHSVFITKDSEMIELKEGLDYLVETRGGIDEWSRYTYTIFSRNFDNDARYTVSIHSCDEAGNINISDSDKKNAEVSFCVDKTKPLCIPLNIADNRTYRGESYTARLSVSDNIVLKNIRVYVDGLPVTTRLNDDECTFNISNSSSAREVCVVLTDMAGNEEEYYYKNILVTTNIFRLLFRKTWFKITAGVAALLACAAAVVIRKRKKRLL
ncbi:hypothetical protein [Ruminococcus flavefaciens]|uniref:Ig-like domain (Group 3) n=1 Tax=Ruminococcus flavefaciens TaxID=1265 RepID=A0A1M7L5G1_RUMFL|nr:hypothetical protein [Ruminococcus flavefaciens]SHM72963.1 hypothetical protein SAMN04487860_11174 [Ruminococcus flavefaciens]